MWTCKEVCLLLVPQSSTLIPIFILEVGNGSVGSRTTLHNSSSDKDEKQADGGTINLSSFASIFNSETHPFRWIQHRLIKLKGRYNVDA